MRPEFALPHGASPPGNGIPQNHYSPIKNKMKKHFANEPSPCKRWRRWSRKNTGIFASLHKQVTIGVLSCSMSILLLTTPEDIFAQSFETDSVKELDISEITVTGNILPPTRTAVLPIPILDRTDAAVAPLQTIEAALRLSPSVDVRERGSKGVQADISIRGGSFDQTLIMLNGVDFTDARTGHQSHSLPIDLDIVSGISVEDGTAGIGAFRRSSKHSYPTVTPHLFACRNLRRTIRVCLRQLVGRHNAQTVYAVRRRVIPGQRRLYEKHRFQKLQRFCSCRIRQPTGRIFRRTSRLATHEISEPTVSIRSNIPTNTKQHALSYRLSDGRKVSVGYFSNRV